MPDNIKKDTEKPTSSNIVSEKKKDSSDIKKDKDLSVEEKLKETEDKLLRSLAEIENQRRRFEKEIKDAFDFGSFNFARESLAILDNLQRAKIAMRNDPDLKNNKDLNKFIENINIIERDLASIFEKNNIKKIETENKKFDPNIHQAMTEIEDNSVETGVILQEMQAGYMLGTRLLRPALVGVAKKKMLKMRKITKKKRKNSLVDNKKTPI